MPDNKLFIFCAHNLTDIMAGVSGISSVNPNSFIINVPPLSRRGRLVAPQDLQAPVRSAKPERHEVDLSQPAGYGPNGKPVYRTETGGRLDVYT